MHAAQVLCVERFVLHLRQLTMRVRLTIGTFRQGIAICRSGGKRVSSLETCISSDTLCLEYVSGS